MSSFESLLIRISILHEFKTSCEFVYIKFIMSWIFSYSFFDTCLRNNVIKSFLESFCWYLILNMTSKRHFLFCSINCPLILFEGWFVIKIVNALFWVLIFNFTFVRQWLEWNNVLFEMFLLAVLLFSKNDIIFFCFTRLIRTVKLLN